MLNPLNRSIPLHSPSSITRLVIFLSLSVLLMVLDHRGQYLQVIRNALSVLVAPVQMAAQLPAEMSETVSEMMETDEEREAAFQKLKAERPLLMARLQKLESLEKENQRLRQLLGSSQKVSDRAIVAELIEVHPEPFTRKIIIARGATDGVYPGQPALDAYGVLGQVTRVNLTNSVVTLITDSSHSIPVMVNRNGLRTIVQGTGAQNRLRVPYLTDSVSIEEGDLLITSGMGSIFPEGYPVAVVKKITNDPNEAFLEIEAEPKARLNHNKQVLLIWPGKTR